MLGTLAETLNEDICPGTSRRHDMSMTALRRRCTDGRRKTAHTVSGRQAEFLKISLQSISVNQNSTGLAENKIHEGQRQHSSLSGFQVYKGHNFKERKGGREEVKQCSSLEQSTSTYNLSGSVEYQRLKQNVSATGLEM